uniref:Ovule protein n=1 Tax=Heterorhabditis bacteriophora TaxID=37862 RepID=A0A1I7WSY9_HETBA
MSLQGMRLSASISHSDNQSIQTTYKTISSECETIKTHPLMPILQVNFYLGTKMITDNYSVKNVKKQVKH